MQLVEWISGRLFLAPLLLAAGLGGVMIAQRAPATTTLPMIELPVEASALAPVPVQEVRREERVPARTRPSECEHPPKFHCGHAASEWFRRNGCDGRLPR